MICRLNGRSRAHAQEAAERTLRAMMLRGVEGQAMPAEQGARLLARQLRQVPRWLQQTRYNGPPPLKMPRGSIATASNYSNNAALAGDGQHVAFESYESKLAVAKARGEIGVVAGSLTGETTLIRRPDRGGRVLPASAYNPSVSGDGRFVAFESAEGNLNFAKRYGQMGVWVRDVRRGTSVAASKNAVSGPFSAYNPSLSADGRRVAFETSESEHGALAVWVTDLQTLRPQQIPRPPGVTSDLYEPALSPDGDWLAFTALSGVYLRDLRTGRVVQVADGDAWEPVVSAGGRHVAFTRGTRVVVRDMATGDVDDGRAARGLVVGVRAVAVARRDARGVHRARRRRAGHRRLRARPRRRARPCSPRGRPAPPARRLRAPRRIRR